MAHRSPFVLLALPFLLAGGPRAAGAVSLEVDATLTIVPASVVVPPISGAGVGLVAVNGSGGGAHVTTVALPSNLVKSTGVVVPVSDPNAFPIVGAQLTVANGAGAIVGSGGAVPLDGFVRWCLFSDCPSALANISVPLSVVGLGGTATVTGPVNVTVVGAPWTTGTAMIQATGAFGTGSITATGFRQGPDGMTSSTAQASGVIQLVTPIFISTDIGGLPRFDAFAVMTLHFVPEPATFALLAGGLGCLAGAGRRQMRAR